MDALARKQTEGSAGACACSKYAILRVCIVFLLGGIQILQVTDILLFMCAPGLPVGVQIVCPQFHEELVLRFNEQDRTLHNYFIVLYVCRLMKQIEQRVAFRTNQPSPMCI
jgi:hypothetical protein